MSLPPIQNQLFSLFSKGSRAKPITNENPCNGSLFTSNFFVVLGVVGYDPNSKRKINHREERGEAMEVSQRSSKHPSFWPCSVER